MTFKLDQEQLDALIENFLRDLAREESLIAQKLEAKTLDPFIFAIEFAAEGTSSWRASAATQALRKARESKIGDLHEALFGLVPGWEVKPRQNAEPDLVCHDKSLIVEMKSRQDTVKGSSQKDVYDDILANVNGRYRGYQGIYCYWLNKTKKVSVSQSTFARRIIKLARPGLSTIESFRWTVVCSGQCARSSAGINGPYENLNAIFEVYQQVFECIDKFGK